MWQQIIASRLVLAAAIYAARTLGPRRWRRKSREGSPGCGCGKDDAGGVGRP